MTLRPAGSVSSTPHKDTKEYWVCEKHAYYCWVKNKQNKQTRKSHNKMEFIFSFSSGKNSLPRRQNNPQLEHARSKQLYVPSNRSLWHVQKRKEI